MYKPNCFAATQRGAALLMSLLFFIIVALLGASAMRTSITVEKMASNLNDQQLSFQAAESALIDIDDKYIDVENQYPDSLRDPQTISDALNGALGLYGPGNLEPTGSALFKADNWNDDNSRRYVDAEGANPLLTIKEAARTKIKRLHPNELRDGGFFFALNVPKLGKPKPAVFRVISRSHGGSDRSQTVLRSHVRKDFER